MKFKDAKEWILENAGFRNACIQEKLRIKNSKNFEDICHVIQDNIQWVISNRLFIDTKMENIIPIEYLLKFGIIKSTEDSES